MGDGQVVVAGVIDPLTNFGEQPEVGVDRLERMVQVGGDPTRVLAETDCGFDTSAGPRKTWCGRSCAQWPTGHGSRRNGWR